MCAGMCVCAGVCVCVLPCACAAVGVCVLPCMCAAVPVDVCCRDCVCCHVVQMAYGYVCLVLADEYHLSCECVLAEPYALFARRGTTDMLEKGEDMYVAAATPLVISELRSK